MDSPALSVRSDFSDMDDEQLDLYLATCVPLSSLPTPPPAKQQQPLPIPAPLPSPPAEESLPYTHELEGQYLHYPISISRVFFPVFYIERAATLAFFGQSLVHPCMDGGALRSGLLQPNLFHHQRYVMAVGLACP